MKKELKFKVGQKVAYTLGNKKRFEGIIVEAKYVQFIKPYTIKDAEGKIHYANEQYLSELTETKKPMQVIPTKKGQIVRIYNPLPDENTDTLYMVLTDPAPYTPNDQITIVPLSELKKTIPFTDRIEIKDLHVVRETI